MRARESRCSTCFARADGKLVAHCINRDRATKILRCRLEPIADLLIRIREGKTSHANLCGATENLRQSRYFQR
jgi:hypothetical protein